MEEYTVGDFYRIVFNYLKEPEERYGILKEKCFCPLITFEHCKNILNEPFYETSIKYLFLENNELNTIIHVEDWEIEDGIVEIFKQEYFIK